MEQIHIFQSLSKLKSERKNSEKKTSFQFMDVKKKLYAETKVLTEVRECFTRWRYVFRCFSGWNIYVLWNTFNSKTLKKKKKKYHRLTRNNKTIPAKTILYVFLYFCFFFSHEIKIAQQTSLLERTNWKRKIPDGIPMEKRITKCATSNSLLTI